MDAISFSTIGIVDPIDQLPSGDIQQTLNKIGLSINNFHHK